jgi:hypothetical protein
MVTVMKLLAVLLSVFSAAAFAAPEATLGQVRSVYLLPMANGFDQYLANQLIGGQVLRVVTDPKQADAVLTERLGPAFEDALENLLPKPEPPPKPAPAAKSGDKKTDESSGEADADAPQQMKADKTRVASTFGRGKGTLFLVDVRSRDVLWSIFEKPADNSPETLNRTAKQIAARLKAAREQKEKAEAGPSGK